MIELSWCDLPFFSIKRDLRSFDSFVSLYFLVVKPYWSSNGKMKIKFKLNFYFTKKTEF